MSLQDRCDALAYPPTHSYNVESLAPKGPLVERVGIIGRVAPELFTGIRFLDIGCNKGWFSLRAARTCQDVVGIDPDGMCIELCKQMAPSNCHFLVGTFGSIKYWGTFDRVFMGNGPHYPFIESGGWGFVEKLASLSSDLLVTEGPVGMECEDMKKCIPENLTGKFNRDDFYSVMSKHWRCEAVAPSVSYTPDRYVIAWRRIDDLVHCDMARYADYLRIVYARMAEWVEPQDSVIEIGVRHDRGVISREYIKCDRFDGLDLDPSRCPAGGYKADAVRDTLPEADVFISTAILHHLPAQEIGPLLRNLHKYAGKRAIFTGPDVRVLPDLMGDHKWHIDLATLAREADAAGWRLIEIDGIGLNQPYSELFVVMEKA